MGYMQCPECGSNFLMIRLEAGLERLLVMITGLREYRCQECDETFRAPDRRKGARAAAKVPAPHRQAA